MTNSNETSHATTLTLGLQNLNTLLGAQRNGLRCGEMVLVNGLEHHYKTGFGLMLLAQIALRNKANLEDASKQAVLTVFTVDGEHRKTLEWLYDYFKKNLTGEDINVRPLSTDVLSLYVDSVLATNGWCLDFVKLPGDVTTHTSEVADAIAAYEPQGYEMVYCFYDGADDHSAENMDIVAGAYRSLRELASDKAFVCVATHPLSEVAVDLPYSADGSFVKAAADQGLLRGGDAVRNEVDLELYIHLEIDTASKVLTIQRGKHRSAELSRNEDLYCKYPFDSKGTILMDLKAVG